MGDKIQNILSLIIAILIIGFFFFAIMHWIFRWSVGDAMNVAISGTMGGLFAPYVVKFFKKKKKTFE